jgi:hypothetical protein
MPDGSARLPERFPPDSKYVLEARGGIVHRYVEFPDGRKVELSPRKALTCKCKAERDLARGEAAREKAGRAAA